MERTYQSYLGFMDKVKALSRHRAIRYDSEGKLAAKLNHFIERVSDEVAACKVSPGVIEEETAPLSEFLTG